MKNRDKLTMTRDEKAHKPEGRPERVPFNQGAKLSVPKHIMKGGWHYHWFVDKAGELEGAEAAWYQFVLVDNKKYTTPAGEGANGQPRTHYLMRIEDKHYKQDMAKQQEMVNKTMHDSIKVKKAKGEYSPEGEDSAVTRDII